MEPLVGIIIGSDSDLGVMSKTAEILTASALNAGILAAKIIATNDEALADRLEAYATNMKETVEKKAAKLESICSRNKSWLFHLLETLHRKCS